MQLGSLFSDCEKSGKKQLIQYDPHQAPSQCKALGFFIYKSSKTLSKAMPRDPLIKKAVFLILERFTRFLKSSKDL